MKKDKKEQKATANKVYVTPELICISLPTITALAGNFKNEDCTNSSTCTA